MAEQWFAVAEGQRARHRAARARLLEACHMWEVEPFWEGMLAESRPANGQWGMGPGRVEWLGWARSGQGGILHGMVFGMGWDGISVGMTRTGVEVESR